MPKDGDKPSRKEAKAAAKKAAAEKAAAEKATAGDPEAAFAAKQKGLVEAGKAVWANRPMNLPQDRWKEANAICKDSFPGVCSYFLLSSCARGANCKFKHEKPARFDELIAGPFGKKA